MLSECHKTPGFSIFWNIWTLSPSRRSLKPPKANPNSVPLATSSTSFLCCFSVSTRP